MPRDESGSTAAAAITVVAMLAIGAFFFYSTTGISIQNFNASVSSERQKYVLDFWMNMTSNGQNDNDFADWAGHLVYVSFINHENLDNDNINVLAYTHATNDNFSKQNPFNAEDYLFTAITDNSYYESNYGKLGYVNGENMLDLNIWRYFTKNVNDDIKTIWGIDDFTITQVALESRVENRYTASVGWSQLYIDNISLRRFWNNTEIETMLNPSFEIPENDESSMNYWATDVFDGFNYVKSYNVPAISRDGENYVRVYVQSSIENISTYSTLWQDNKTDNSYSLSTKKYSATGENLVLSLEETASIVYSIAPYVILIAIVGAILTAVLTMTNRKGGYLEW